MPKLWLWRWKSGSLHESSDEKPFGQVILYPAYEYDSGVETVVSEENARKIAAVPVMLEALKRIQSYAQRQSAHNSDETALWAQIVQFATPAINAAEGRDDA